MKAPDKLADKLLMSLRRHSPAKVRAYTSDDDTRDIAVPTRRRRWSQVIEAIEARAWSRVELLDKSGAVLGYVENAEPAGELSELGPSGNRTMSAVTEAQRIVEIVIRAQRETMSFRDSEVTALLQAQGAVMREMVAGMQALSAIHAEQREAAEETAAMRATAEAGQGGTLKELIDAAPTLLPMLPMLKGLLGIGEPQKPAPSNGAHKKA